MVWGQVFDVECIMDQVFGVGDVNLICVVVDALEDLEGTISSWMKLGLSGLQESVLAEV